MAKAIPGKLNAFLNKQLNVWTENEVCWLNPEDWNACDGTTIDRAALRGLPCYAGLDLSTRIDLTAFVLWFPTINTVLPFFWMPKENIKRRVVQDRVPYDAWARDGLIETTAGNEIDQEAIRRRINELSAEFEIRGIGFDKWNATQMSHWLQKDGATVLELRQNFGCLSPPTKKLEALFLSRAIRHGSNPVLKWMAGNVVLLQDSNGNYRPDKGKSRERIDGIVAWIMALHFDVNPTEPPKESVYKTRGLLAL
jgi:phage terminase large subunit-like protein